MKIVCMGELFLDMFPAQTGVSLGEVAAFLPVAGGAAANVAVQISRLGGDSAFIGKVGDEAFGHHLADVLANEGVDIRGVRFDPYYRTTTTFIALPDENSAEFLFFRNPGADMRFTPAELDLALIRSAQAFYFGSLGLIDEPLRSTQLMALAAARASGSLVIFDANYRATLWQDEEQARNVMSEVLGSVDLLKINEKELQVLTGLSSVSENVAAQLLLRGPKLIVLTRGPQGSDYFGAEGSGHADAFAVPAVDATGCGDSFLGSLLFQLLQGPDWKANLIPTKLDQALRFANASAALTAMQRGVIPALPSLERVNGFLASAAKNGVQ